MKRKIQKFFIFFIPIIISCSQYDIWNNGTSPIDILPPEIQNLTVDSNTVITVDFAEDVELVSATTSSNYIIEGLDITSAVRNDTDYSIITLTTSSQEDIEYTLEITDVIDKFRNEVLEPIETTFTGDALPVTGITTPRDGFYVHGEVTITASASDDDEITSVKIFIDTADPQDTPAAELTTAPYTYTWDTTSLADGSSHTIMSVASDISGNISETDIITVIIDNEAPTVEFNPPLNTAVNGTVTITAVPDDQISSITHVDLLIDSVFITRDYSAPYEFTWDTNSAATGEHTVTLRSSDSAGNVSVDNEVKVTVDNEGPVVVFNPPLNTYVSGSVNIVADPQDALSGIQSVEFMINGAVIATVYSSPYECSWDTTGLSEGSDHNLALVAYDILGNASNPAEITVTVDNTSPTVYIYSPTGGSFSDSTITIIAYATDSISGIDYVDFYVIDNNSVVYYLGTDDTDDTAPYYTLDWDRTGYDLGLIYTIRVEAFDNAGNSAINSDITINLL